MTSGALDPASRGEQPSKSPLRWVFFGLGALGILMSSIDQTIVTVAIPALTSALDAPLSWVTWTITANQLLQIVTMPVAGKLSDAFGRKRVFMFSAGCFAVGSLLCGLAPNIGFLILFRAIEAIGAGGLMPSAVGIAMDEFGKDRRNQVVGLLTSAFPIGGILGPNIGGFVLEHFSWRAIFFINLPICLAILVGTQLVLRERRNPGAIPHRLDTAGLALFVGGMVSIMYAMTAVGNNPGIWRTPFPWALVAAGLLLFAVFVWHERRAEQPILDVNLIARRPFLPANLYNFFYGAGVFGFFAFIPYYAVVQYQMTAVQSGVILTPRSAAALVASSLTSIFLLRLGYRLPMLVGMGLVTVCLVLLGFGWNQVFIGPLELDGFWLTAVIVGISGMGTGMAAPAANNASMDLMPEKAAAISGLRGMFRQSGGIVGISAVALALSLFEDKAAGMRIIFIAMALILQLTVPLTLMIPDSARDRRRAASVRGSGSRVQAKEQGIGNKE